MMKASGRRRGIRKKIKKKIKKKKKKKEMRKLLTGRWGPWASGHPWRRAAKFKY